MPINQVGNVQNVGQVVKPVSRPAPSTKNKVTAPLTKRKEFLRKEVEKAQSRLPVKTQTKPNQGTLFAKRNKRIAIREGALRRAYIDIRYRKMTTGEVNIYRVAPYEIKIRPLRIGQRYVLWAYDVKDRRIKSFVFNNILNVALTDKKFKPMWQVKIT